MATEQQLIKLEKISKVVKNNKDKDIPNALSRGRIGYAKAIKSMMLVGEWATLTAILSVVIAIGFLAVRNITTYDGPSQYEINLAILVIVCSIISGVLGKKLWDLSVTPIFALVSLVFILACNLFLCIGILPVIVVILDIIAVIRYSTFCSWFHKV